MSNLLNLTNYAAPNLQLNSGSFGVISAVQSVEQGGPRTIQLAFRISF